MKVDDSETNEDCAFVLIDESRLVSRTNISGLNDDLGHCLIATLSQPNFFGARVALDAIGHHTGKR